MCRGHKGGTKLH